MLEAIENRISRRTFNKEYLSKEEIKQINDYIKKLNKESNLKIEFLEDGSSAFSSLTKSYGLFTNVHSLVLLKGDKTDVNLKEKVGYYGEELVLKLTDLKLGTCWVGGTFDKEKIKISDKEEIVCVIVVGKVKEMSLKEKLIRTSMSKKRKQINERLITDVDKIPDFIINGMNAVVLAPSARNSQKVIFEYKNGNLSAKVPDDYYFDLVDLGIAKKHFEIATNIKMGFGNGNIISLTNK